MAAPLAVVLAVGLVVPVALPVAVEEGMALEVVATATLLALALPQTQVTLHCCWPARSPALVFMQSPLPWLQMKAIMELS